MIKYHVVPNGIIGWRVVKNKYIRASGRFKTKLEAIKEAKRLVKLCKGQLIVHGKNGRIQYERIYYKEKFK
jgi:hypothetical protein